MKFIITESKLRDAIFKYLDDEKFVMYNLDKRFNNYIYLLDSHNDKRARISIYNTNAFGQLRNWVFIDYKLVNEVMLFFSISREDSIISIANWVGDELGFEPKEIYKTDGEHEHRLIVNRPTIF